TAPATAAATASLTTEQIRQATIEHIRDSIILAENAKAARAAADSAARLAADSATKADARHQAEQDSTERAANVAAVERARQDRVASGNKALSDWMTSVAAATSAGQTQSAALSVAPAPFIEFVRKNHPTLRNIKLGTTRVDQQIAEGTVE